MLFNKGQYYDIATIKNDYITIYINKDHNEKGPLYRFALIKPKNIEPYTGIYFYDYFNTIQEERKFKLEKINSRI